MKQLSNFFEKSLSFQSTCHLFQYVMNCIYHQATFSSCSCNNRNNSWF